MDYPGARKLLAQVTLSNVLGDIYTPPPQPPNSMGFVQAMFVANVAAAGHAFTIRVGPAGATTFQNALFEGNAIAANTTRVDTGNEWVIIVPAGWHIQGLADAASVIVVTLFGSEMT